jgi:glycosyltransferase involved in cell wall biosynthesis
MNIWLVAFYFPPMNIIGSERPKKFLRYFAARQFDATVFTVDVPEIDGSDAFAGFSCRRSKVAYEDYHFSLSTNQKHPSFLRWFTPRAITALLDDAGWSWALPLRQELKAAWSEGNRPDVIIATGRPFLTFLTVSQFARKNRVPFLLDYRDAWADNPHSTFQNSFRRNMLRWLERRVNHEASGIITVSNFTAKALSASVSPVIIYNLPDQGYVDELKDYLREANAASSDRLILVYTGTLYPGRDLDPICAALATLDVAVRKQIEVHYCGNSAARARASFQRYGVQDQLVEHGSLSKADATRLVASAHLALSIICSDARAENDALRGVITTKVFDYLLLDKDVLNIVPEGFEFHELAKKFRLLGLHNIDPSRVVEIAEFLKLNVSTKGTLANSARGDRALALTQAWDAQMSRLDALLRSVCSSR